MIAWQSDKMESYVTITLLAFNFVTPGVGSTTATHNKTKQTKDDLTKNLSSTKVALNDTTSKNNSSTDRDEDYSEDYGYTRNPNCCDGISREVIQNSLNQAGLSSVECHTISRSIDLSDGKYLDLAISPESVAGLDKILKHDSKRQKGMAKCADLKSKNETVVNPVEATPQLTTDDSGTVPPLDDPEESQTIPSISSFNPGGSGDDPNMVNSPNLNSEGRQVECGISQSEESVLTGEVIQLLKTRYDTTYPNITTARLLDIGKGLLKMNMDEKELKFMMMFFSTRLGEWVNFYSVETPHAKTALEKISNRQQDRDPDVRALMEAVEEKLNRDKSAGGTIREVLNKMV